MANLETLPLLLKELKLSSIARHWEPLSHKALDQHWLPQQYLANLCEEEVNDRYHRRLQRYLREAQIPPGKHLSSFQFEHVKSLQANQMTALVTQTQWVKQANNVLLFGPSGLGKTPSGVGYCLWLNRKRLAREVLQCECAGATTATGQKPTAATGNAGAAGPIQRAGSR